jgi:hypothetical protein
MKKLKYIKLFDNFQVNEKTFYGGIDPADIYSFINKKDSDSYKKIKDSNIKEIYLSDLIDTHEGRYLFDDYYFESFLELIKELNLKINLKKAKIEHPQTLLDIKNTLIKNNLLSLDELINANVFDSKVLDSHDWSYEVVNKIDKTNNNDLSNMVQIIKNKVKK